MKRYVLFDPATGRITQSGICDDAAFAVLQNAIEVSGPVDDSMWYVVAGALAPRQPFPGAWDRTTIVANGSDVATLSGVPAGLQMRVAADVLVINDGILEVSAALVGRYTVEILDPRYQEQEWRIEAT